VIDPTVGQLVPKIILEVRSWSLEHECNGCTAGQSEPHHRLGFLSAAADVEANLSLAWMKSRLLAVILGVALASSLVAIYSTIGETSLDKTWEIETGSNEGSHGGQRRSLLMKKWKARKMCPPGLDICRDEEKRKAEEIAERHKAKEEREKEDAKELEELSDKVLSSSSSVPFFSHYSSYFSSVFVDEKLNFLVGGCFLPLCITILLLGCSALLGIIISQ